MIVGSISYLGDSFSINAKLVNVDTAEITAAKATTFKNVRRLRNAAKIIVMALGKRAQGEGGGIGAQSDMEMFQNTSSRAFYDAATIIVSNLDTIRFDVRGEVDTVNTSKRIAYLNLTGKYKSIKPGVRLAIVEEGFDGWDVKGELYIKKIKPGGRVQASWFGQVPDGASMGAKVLGIAHKQRVAVGMIDDVDEGNDRLVNRFIETIREKMGESESVEGAESAAVQTIKTCKASSKRACFKNLFSQGVDLVVGGKIMGTAGHRRIDFKVWNAYSGKVVKTIRMETKL